MSAAAGAAAAAAAAAAGASDAVVAAGAAAAARAAGAGDAGAVGAGAGAAPALTLPERAVAVATAVAAGLAARTLTQHLAEDPKWPKWARTLNEGLNGLISEVRTSGLHPARGALTATILAGKAETGRTCVRNVTITDMTAQPVGFQRLMDALVVYCPRLSQIQIRGNVHAAIKFGSTFARVVSLDAPLQRSLTDVSLDHTDVSNADVMVMAEALGTHCSNLRRFAVQGGGICDTGVAAIATHILRPGSKLEHLDLHNNVAIGDAGVRALARAVARDATSIRTLDLHFNTAITDRGMAALAYALLDSSTFVDIALPRLVGGASRGDAEFELLAGVNYHCTGGIYGHTRAAGFAANTNRNIALRKYLDGGDQSRLAEVDMYLRRGVAFDTNDTQTIGMFRGAIRRVNLPVIRILFHRLSTREFESLANRWIFRHAHVIPHMNMPAARVDELRALVMHRATTRMCAVIFCHEQTARETYVEDGAALAAYGVVPQPSTVAHVVTASPRRRMLSPTWMERVTVTSETRVTTVVEVMPVCGLGAVPFDMLRHCILPHFVRAKRSMVSQLVRRGVLVAKTTAISLDRDLCAKEDEVGRVAAACAAAAVAARDVAAAVARNAAARRTAAEQSPLKRARHE